MRVAAIEGGGTKFLVAVGSPGSISNHSISIATATPAVTLPQLLSYLRAEHKKEAFHAIGIGSFGPLGIAAERSDYGVIGPTPKPDWSHFSYPKALAEFNVPLVITTDVNAAAIAESNLGSAGHGHRVIYITVGTGIGGGIVINNQLDQGKFHPEVGHMKIAVNPDDPMPEGFCRFHGNCLEGLASGLAIERRWGANLSDLSPNHPGNDLQAKYLAQMCMNLLLTITPDSIILGGGVMQTPFLLAKVRLALREMMNHYMPQFSSEDAVAKLIKAPALAPFSGLVGAALLAQGVIRKKSKELAACRAP